MMERTRIAKELRDDDIRYLKDIADGKPAQKRTENIVQGYHLNFKKDVFYPSLICTFVFCFFVNESLKPLRGIDESFLLVLIGWIFACWPTLKGYLLIRDYREATEIYPEINSILASSTNFVPSWGMFALSILYGILGSIALIGAIIGYLRYFI